MSALRILFVHDRFGSLAGAEANVAHTAAALARRGVTVGLAHGPGTGRDEERWGALFPRRFALAPGAEAMGLVAAVRVFAPAVIYLHNLADSDGLAALAAADVPVVRMIHDHRLFCLRGCRYPAWSRAPCTRALSPFCVFPCGGFVARDHAGGWPLRWNSYRRRRRELDLHHRFHRLLVAGDYMRTELLRNGLPADRIEIHPPVPPPAAAGPPPTFSPSNRIVYAGQIVRGKGVDVLLEALALVRAPFRCAILGDGPQRPACEARARQLGLDRRVRFHGYVPPAGLGEHYRDASLAVVSSVWPEPFGAVGVEAMRRGLPVVAFDAGGIGEWLRDGVNGHLVPWMDRAAFAARVDSLLFDKERARRLGARGRELAAERFDFDRYINRLAATLTRAAGLPLAA